MYNMSDYTSDLCSFEFTYAIHFLFLFLAYMYICSFNKIYHNCIGNLCLIIEGSHDMKFLEFHLTKFGDIHFLIFMCAQPLFSQQSAHALIVYKRFSCSQVGGYSTFQYTTLRKSAML
jgi:hypothetical protein